MKRFLCLVLCVLMALPLCAFAESEPSEWAKEELDTTLSSYMKAMGVDMEYQRNITRKEFCYLALEFYNRLSTKPLSQMSIINPFSDVNDPYVLIAYELGIIQGVSESSFAPDNAVTRQEMCVMLVRVLKKAMPDTVNDEMLSAYFAKAEAYSDYASAAQWAKGSVGAAVEMGIMKGVTKTELGLLGNCTIEQALILVGRALTTLNA